jgi:uncharacterized lipoprotein
MNSKSSLARAALSATLVATLLAATGCSWFRGRSGYENSPESRPLEIPPDLDRPATDPSMVVPQVANAPSNAPQGPVTGQSFEIADSGESAWRRLGLALERIEGVTIDDRAQLLSVYNVTFGGESFLVKLAPAGEASRITTVSKDGKELTTGAAGRLLALLKPRLP